MLKTLTCQHPLGVRGTDSPDAPAEVVLRFDKAGCLSAVTGPAAGLLQIGPDDAGRTLDELLPKLGLPVEGGAARPLPDRPSFVNLSGSIHLRTLSLEGGRATLSFRDASCVTLTLQRLTQRDRQHAFVAKLGQAAIGGMPAHDLMHLACCGVRDCINAELTKVLHLSKNRARLDLVSGVGWEEGLVGTASVSASAESQAGFTLLSRDPVIVHDLSTEVRFSGPQLLHDHGVVSGISVVLGDPARPWGVFGAHSRSRSDYNHDDVHFIQSVANILATAVERAGMEATLAANEARHRLIIDAFPALIAYIGADLRYRHCNETYRSWFGRSPSDLIGTTIPEVVGTTAFASLLPEVQRVLGGETVTFERRINYPLLGPREILAHYIPHRTDGEVIGFYSMIQDVTVKKQREVQLASLNRELESRVDQRTRQFGLLAENVPTLFGFVDQQLRFRFANRMLAETLNLPAAEIVGGSVRQILGEENFSRIHFPLLAALGGATQNFEATLHFQPGTRTIARLRLVPHLNARDHDSGIYVLISDITTERSLETAVIEAGELEKQRIGRDLHDSLCQELSGIALLSKALERQLTRNGRDEAGLATQILDRIHDAASQARRMARGLAPVGLDHLSLQAALENLAASLAPVSPEKQISVDCTVDTTLLAPPVSTQIFLIAREAVSNSLRHGRADRIVMQLSSSLTEFRLVVSDNGVGHPAGLDPARGLGLRSMQHRAQLLGGSLRLTATDPGPGITLACLVPLDSAFPN